MMPVTMICKLYTDSMSVQHRRNDSSQQNHRLLMKTSAKIVAYWAAPTVTVDDDNLNKADKNLKDETDSPPGPARRRILRLRRGGPPTPAPGGRWAAGGRAVSDPGPEDSEQLRERLGARNPGP